MNYLILFNEGTNEIMHLINKKLKSVSYKSDQIFFKSVLFKSNTTK
jgi:hypothetical protein